MTAPPESAPPGASPSAPLDPLIAGALRVIRGRGAEFRVDAAGTGFDVAPAAPISAAAARARMRVFLPIPGVLACVFYKRSLLAFSRDRFAYGALVFKRILDPAMLDRGLTWLAAGLPPGSRPPALGRALPFDLPQ